MEIPNGSGPLQAARELVGAIRRRGSEDVNALWSSLPSKPKIAP
jgi:hypothetical protein